jgi:hypothetical protein
VQAQAFGVMLLAALYLMLFNPRTEENSYVILAGFTALMAGRAILEDYLNNAVRPALLLTLFTLAMAVECYGYPIFPLTKIWFKPLATLIFFFFLVAGNFSLLKFPQQGIRAAA